MLVEQDPRTFTEHQHVPDTEPGAWRGSAQTSGSSGRWNIYCDLSFRGLNKLRAKTKEARITWISTKGECSQQEMSAEFWNLESFWTTYPGQQIKENRGKKGLLERQSSEAGPLIPQQLRDWCARAPEWQDSGGLKQES